MKIPIKVPNYNRVSELQGNQVFLRSPAVTLVTRINTTEKLFKEVQIKSIQTRAGMIDKLIKDKGHLYFSSHHYQGCQGKED